MKFKSKFIKTKLIEISGENSPIEIYHYGSWTISLVKEFGGEMYRRKTDWHITNDIGEAWGGFQTIRRATEAIDSLIERSCHKHSDLEHKHRCKKLNESHEEDTLPVILYRKWKYFGTYKALY